MQLKIETLVTGTLFSFNSSKYEKAERSWGKPSSEFLEEGQSFISQECIGRSCVGAHPKLGGQVQTKLTVWFPEDQIVSID